MFISNKNNLPCQVTTICSLYTVQNLKDFLLTIRQEIIKDNYHRVLLIFFSKSIRRLLIW
jgi:hypothetical protein